MEMNGHESGKIQGDVISTPDSYSLLGCFISGGVLYILVAYVCVSVGLSWDDDFTPIYRENGVSNGGFWTVLEWTPIEILAKLEFPIKPGGTRLKFFTSLVPSGKLEGNKLLEGNSPSNHHL